MYTVAVYRQGSTFVSLPDKYMFTIVFSVAKYIKFKIL